MKSYLNIFAASLFISCSGPTKTNNNKERYQLQLSDMHKIVVGNGETVYQAEGKDHNIKDLSFVITETQPGGGPPLHVHPTEEVHVVLKGNVTYYIADSVFTVDAPFLVKIPANTPHTFMNSGDSILNLVGVFPQDNFGPYKPIGKNPLIHQHKAAQ